MTDTTQSFSVRDGKIKVISFDGVLLGEASSRHRSSPRWTEMRMYRTIGGSYIAEKIGRSTVIHAPSCPEIIGELPRFQAVNPGQDPYGPDFWLCEECLDDRQDDITSLLIEEDRHWAAVAKDPADLIDMLYFRKDGAKSLPKAAVLMLEEASQVDANVAKAYGAEYVL